MKKVLVITYYWPPSGGSGVQRWLKTSKYLPKFGWTPVIYTPENPDVNAVDESLLKDVSPELEVIKRKIREPYAAYKFLSGKKKGEHIQANIVSGEKKGFVQKLSGHIRANWFIPDPRIWWVRPSVRFLKKHIGSLSGENCPDAIISTGPPHSMHLIAKEIHKALNIPWIADFRDPWTNIFYFKHLGLSEKSLRKHKALERSVLEEADRIVVVSQQMKSEFSTGEYSQFADKISVVPNGYDPDDFSTEKNPELAAAENEIAEKTKGKFVVAHAGLLPKSADPDKLWMALGNLAKKDAGFRDKLLIAVMGQTDGCVKEEIAENGLSDNFVDLGYIPHTKSIAWMKRANLLLLPLRKEKESKAIVTGKFFEYLATGNTILAFGPVDGNLAEELSATGSGNICEFVDENGIRNSIEKVWTDFNCGEEKNSEDKIGARGKFSRVKASEDFAKMLDEITQK